MRCCSHHGRRKAPVVFRPGLATQPVRSATQPVSRRDLLYLSPVMPAVVGNGLAMRAGMVLEALAVDHNVHVMEIPVHRQFGPPGMAYEVISRWWDGRGVLG